MTTTSRRPRAVVASGGLDYDDTDQRFRAALARARPDIVIHGDFSYADQIARRWALLEGLQTIACPPTWKGTDAEAGHARNTFMVQLLRRFSDTHDIAVIVAPGGPGTEHLAAEAEQEGVPVYRLPERDSR